MDHYFYTRASIERGPRDFKRRYAQVTVPYRLARANLMPLDNPPRATNSTAYANGLPVNVRLIVEAIPLNKITDMDFANRNKPLALHVHYLR